MLRNLCLAGVLVCVMAIVTACVLSYDVDPGDIDMTVTFTRDASCPDVTGYVVLAGKPYDKSFAATFEGENVVQHWVGMPEGEFVTEIQLARQVGGELKQFPYSVNLSKSLGESLAFTAVCDEASSKPVLLLDKIPTTLVFTSGEPCRLYTGMEVFDATRIDAETSQPILSRLLTADILRVGREVFYWADPTNQTPQLLVRLTEKISETKEVQRDFLFSADLSLGNRLDFSIGCDSDSNDPQVLLSIGGTDIGPQDDDSDGDVDEADGDGDGDLEGVDGDAEVEEESPDGDADGDDADGDSDGDIDETDGDIDVTEAEAEEEIPCGTEDPNLFRTFEAETAGVFLSAQSSANASIATLTEGSTLSGDSYVHLDAEGIGEKIVAAFTIAADWDYAFNLDFAAGADGWGLVEVYVDDLADPLSYDFGKTEVNLDRICAPPYAVCKKTQSFQPICLKAGAHTLTVEVVGTQTAGHTAGLDRIGLISN